MVLSLVVALTLSARPLTAKELASVQQQLGGRQPIAGQAFETEALAPDTRHWFIPAQKDGDFLGLLLDAEKKAIGRLELDSSAHERLVSFDAVAFIDVNDDGQADVVAVVRVKSEAAPVKRKALLLLRTGSGFTQDTEQERSVTVALGERMTVAKIRDRLRPPLLSKVTVSCQSMTLPLALSREGLLAFTPFERPYVRSLISGDPPSWMTPRLQGAIERVDGPGCSWKSDEDLPHGGGPSCTAPIAELNDVLAGLPDAPTFADTAGELDAGAADLRGSMLYLKSGMAGFKPGRLPLPSSCPVGQGDQVIGALASDREVAIFLAPKDVEVPTSMYKDPEEAEECYRSGGTCVQDIVPAPVDYPRVVLVTVEPSP